MCEIATAGETPEVVSVPLVGQPAYFDDVRYAVPLGKVVAAPMGTGRLYLVDPQSLEVTSFGVPGGSASADASATTMYVADRQANQIIAFATSDHGELARKTLDGSPDYVRVAPNGEIWVTLPGRSRIDILDAITLAPIAEVIAPGPPEGLTFDARGRAYVQVGGRMVAIDIARRVVVGEWENGCGKSHGFAQADDGFGLMIAGCSENGGAAVLSASGELLTGFEAGGGEAILAYDSTRHHLYLRGDPGPTLEILATCRTGGLGVLASVPIPDEGHGATVDDRGHVWIVDATTGGLVRITDPFPAVP